MSDDTADPSGRRSGSQAKTKRDPRTTGRRRRVPTPAVFEPGAVVAKRYTIRGVVRSESGVQIFKADDQKHSTQVFLEVALQSPALRRRLERETEIAQRIRGGEADPSYLLLRGWGGEAGLMYKVFDVAAGGRTEAFNPTRGDVDARLGVFGKLVRRVEELHRHGVVHCNLRPSSCRIGEDGRLFLGGFGLAVALDGSRRVEPAQVLALRGSHAYLSPECAVGDAVDERSDVYSLGAMLFEVLSGEVPYPGSLPAIVRAQTEVLHGARPPLPQGVDETCNGLARLCVKATQPDPSKRPHLTAFLEELRGRAPRGRPSPRSQAKPRASVVMPRATGRTRAPASARPAEGAPFPQTDPPRVEECLRAVERLLPVGGAADVVRDGDVLRFAATHWSRMVALSFSVDPSGRWGTLRRQSKYDPEQLKGEPSGLVNLLYAANAFNRAGVGARLSLWTDELCFDRTILLTRRATSKALSAGVEALLRASFTGLEALRPIREGTNWYAGTRALSDAPTDDSDDLPGVQQRMAEARLDVRSEDDALLCQYKEQQIRLTTSRGDLQATRLVLPASSPRASIKLKLGEAIPECDELVGGLNQRQAKAPITLVWDPKVGVVAMTAVTAASCRGDDFRVLLDWLLAPRGVELLTGLAQAVTDLSRH